jgi:hypothetical protein
MDEWFNEQTGQAYVSCTWLSFSNLSDDPVSRANIRSLRNTPGTVLRSGGYGTQQLWLPDTEENRELLQGLLDDYPVVDDSEVSAVEYQMEQESYSNWIRDDLARPLPHILHEYVDSLDNDWELYWEAREASNEYPVFESGGLFIRSERIAPQFRRVALEWALNDAQTEAGVKVAPDDLVGWRLLSDHFEEAGNYLMAELLRWYANGQREDEEE